MRAIVLAGGEGTRLRPLTWRTPKPLVPLLNRPLMEHLLLHLREHGVDHVTLALTRTALGAAAIEEAFGHGEPLGLRLEYAFEDQPLGSGGAIASIAQGWDETFLVCNGDIVTDLDLSAMRRAHIGRGAELSISLYEVEDPSPFGVADVDADTRIRRFVEKPPREEAPSHLVNSGMWLFEPSLLAEMDATSFNRVEDTLFPALCHAGRPVYGFEHGRYWADVGTAAALLRVNLELAAARHGGLLIAPDASIAAGARILPPAVIGPGCVIEDGATVEGSVLWDGVHVGAGATVRSSLLATRVRIGDRATLQHAVVAHEATVATDTGLDGVTLEPAATGAPS